MSLCCYVVNHIFHRLDLECCSCVWCLSSVIYFLVWLMNVGTKGRIFGVKFVPGKRRLVAGNGAGSWPDSSCFSLFDSTLMFYSISTKNTCDSSYTLLTIYPCLVCMLVPLYRDIISTGNSRGHHKFQSILLYIKKKSLSSVETIWFIIGGSDGKKR